MKNLFFGFLLVLANDLKSQNTYAEIQSSLQNWLSGSEILVGELWLSQQQYAVNDTLHFAATCTEFSSFKRKGRRILEIFLKDIRGNVFIQGQLMLNSNTVTGQIPLGDSLRTGLYSIQLMQGENLVASNVFEIVGREMNTDRTFAFHSPIGTFIADARNTIYIETGLKNKQVKFVQEGVKTEIVQTDYSGLVRLEIDHQTHRSLYFEDEYGKIYFPQFQKKGLCLRVDKTSNQSARVVMRAVGYTAPTKFYLFLIEKGIVRLNKELLLTESDSVIQEIHYRGLADLFIIDAGGVMQASYSFSEPVAVTISPDQETLFQRQQSSIEIKLEPSTNHSLNGVFSAVQQDLLLNSPALNNYKDLFLAKRSSMLLERFNAKALKEQTKQNLVLTGRAVYGTTNAPLKPNTKIFFYLIGNALGYETVVKEDGKFALTFLYDFYGVDSLFVFASSEDRYVEDLQIEWDERPLPRITNEKTSPNHPDKLIYLNYQRNRKVIEQSYNYFGQDIKVSGATIQPNSLFEEEFLGADVSIKVTDYLVMPSMGELVREIVPVMFYKFTSKGETIRVIFSNKMFKPVDDPLYVIDGRLTKSTKYFLSINPVEVLSIKILNDVYKIGRIGELGKNGIVFVQTRNQNHINDDSIFPNYYITGFFLPSKVYSIRTQAPTKEPIISPSLYWNPSIKLDSKTNSTSILFNTSDDTGPVLLNFWGMLEDGTPYSASKTIHVKFRP